MFTGIGFTILCLSKIYQGIYFDFWRRSECVKKCLKNLKRGNVSDTETAIDQLSRSPSKRILLVHAWQNYRRTHVTYVSQDIPLLSRLFHDPQSKSGGNHLFCKIFQDGSTRLARKTPFYLLTNRFNTATIAELVSSSLFLSREQRRRIYVGSYAKPSPLPPSVQKPFPVPKHRNGRFHRPRYIGYGTFLPRSEPI